MKVGVGGGWQKNGKRARRKIGEQKRKKKEPWEGSQETEGGVGGKTGELSRRR